MKSSAKTVLSNVVGAEQLRAAAQLAYIADCEERQRRDEADSAAREEEVKEAKLEFIELLREMIRERWGIEAAIPFEEVWEVGSSPKAAWGSNRFAWHIAPYMHLRREHGYAGPVITLERTLFPRDAEKGRATGTSGVVVESLAHLHQLLTERPDACFGYPAEED